MIEENEIISLLNEAAFEIKQLRRQNEILSAKVDVMNLFATVLHTQPYYVPQGASVDIAWRLERKINEIKNPPTNTDES